MVLERLLSDIHDKSHGDCARQIIYTRLLGDIPGEQAEKALEGLIKPQEYYLPTYKLENLVKQEAARQLAERQSSSPTASKILEGCIDYIDDKGSWRQRLQANTMKAVLKLERKR